MEKKEKEKEQEEQEKHVLQIHQVELKVTFEDGRFEGSGSPALFRMGRTQSPMAMPDGSQVIQATYVVNLGLVAEWQSRLTEVLSLLEKLKASNEAPIPGMRQTVMPMPVGGPPGGPGRPARGPG